MSKFQFGFGFCQETSFGQVLRPSVSGVLAHLKALRLSSLWGRAGDVGSVVCLFIVIQALNF